MRRLRVEINNLLEENRQIALRACDVADVLRGRLTPAALRDTQVALRDDIARIDARLKSLAERKRKRGIVLARRFSATPYFHECRNLHIDLLERRESLLLRQRALYRQVGDLLAWLVLRTDPIIIGALYARRTHRSPDATGLLGPRTLIDDASNAGTLLVMDNDLTRCLGAGDLTVVSNDDEWIRPLVLEVKTKVVAKHGTQLDVEVAAFGPNANDPSDVRLFDMFRNATAGESPSVELHAVHKKQSDDMRRHMELLHNLLAAKAPVVGGPSGVRWRVVENVLSKALVIGQSADIVEGIAYLAVRARPGDEPVNALRRLRDWLRDFGIGAGYKSRTSEDFQEHDFLSALIPPIALWRLSHPVRSSLLSGELFFAALYRDSVWSAAFSLLGIALTEVAGGWRLTKGNESLLIRQRDVLRLRYALALIGMSPRQVAANVASMFTD